METTHYIPKADEPSPFAIDISFPPNTEWNIWKKAQASGFYGFIAAETARLRLIEQLEGEPPRTPEDLEKLPIGVPTGPKSIPLADLIRVKYRLALSWMAAYRFMKKKEHRDVSD